VTYWQTGLLSAQLEAEIRQANGQVGRLTSLFHRGIKEAQARALLRLPEEEAQAERAQKAEANMVVLADDIVSPHLVKVGTTLEGYHAALSLDRGWVIVALGDRKIPPRLSHQPRRVIEGFSLTTISASPWCA
jgi:hypothetical protein